jgi:hypothetical protein
VLSPIGMLLAIARTMRDVIGMNVAGGSKICTRYHGMLCAIARSVPDNEQGGGRVGTHVSTGLSM